MLVGAAARRRGGSPTTSFSDSRTPDGQLANTSRPSPGFPTSQPGHAGIRAVLTRCSRAMRRRRFVLPVQQRLQQTRSTISPSDQVEFRVEHDRHNDHADAEPLCYRFSVCAAELQPPLQPTTNHGRLDQGRV